MEYINNKTKVCIICPIHGEFWQTPYSHINGRGCKLCNESHLESFIENYLNNKNVNFIREKRFKWLGSKSLDFYLPDYNIAIECQGIQHFKKMDFFDKNDSFDERLKRDIIKKTLCESNNIKLFYFSFENYNSFLDKKILKTKEDLDLILFN